MKSLLLLSVLFLLASFAPTTFAKGDIVAGEEKVKQVCQSCHGLDGLGIDDTYPKLAGQFADYMAKALSDYKSGARKNAIMSGFSATLTEEDIQNVSAYYSQLPENRLKDLSIK